MKSTYMKLTRKKNPTNKTKKAKRTKAMVLTCMDFRFLDKSKRLMNRLGLKNSYDQYILAGASIGYVNPKYNSLLRHWASGFDQHIELAKTLHTIREIVVIDHMDCGAYKLFSNQTNEEKAHQKNLDTCIQQLLKKHNLPVSVYLLDASGRVLYEKKVYI